MTIAPFIHECYYPKGLLEGNSHTKEVSPWELECQEECEVCGEVLATPLQIMVHIYGELSK